MKTPREILLARNSAATPKLDAIRHDVVRETTEVNRRKPTVREFTFAATIAKIIRVTFQELIWPCRRIWTGLAAGWILLAMFNLSQHNGARTSLAKSQPTAEMMMTFRDQQNIVNELFADRSLPVEAMRPRIFSPKPRTETTQLLAA